MSIFFVESIHMRESLDLLEDILQDILSSFLSSFQK